MQDYKRKEERSQMIFGIRPVIEAIRSKKEIEKILIQNYLSNELFGELKALIKEYQIPFQYVPLQKLNRETNKNHQGVIAIVSPVSFYELDDLVQRTFELGKQPFFLVLDRITDVRNFGAIARTAECAGVDAIIIPSRGAAQINADALKTSAGALFKIPVCRSHNLKHSLEYLKESGIQVIACTEKTGSYYYDIEMKGPLAIIMGSEEDGISSEYLKRADFKAKIPLLGEIGSLNVGVAAGIILYEVVKQRLQ